MEGAGYETTEEGWDSVEEPDVNAVGVEKFFKCTQCGAKMTFVPGSASQRCPYCEFENAIPQSEEDIVELDYHSYLATASTEEEMEERLTIKCMTCGAESSFDENVTSKQCPFCGMDIVATAKSSKVIKPKALLPFHIDRRKAQEQFRTWINKLWFAPSALKKMAFGDGGLNGMYVPYWTYDSDTTTFYRGQRGTYYYVTETYTTTENGKQVTKTRKVRKIRWTNVSGTVWNNFDDVLVMASRSLPAKYADKLEPWDLNNLSGYQDEYLSGFRAESYQIDMEEGFGIAKKKMDRTIDHSIRRDIGGDEQRITSKKSRYDNITFKHILLPIWISAYNYKNKAYRFLVNGRTGEVQGERPWDYLKIALTVVGIVIVVGTLYWIFGM